MKKQSSDGTRQQSKTIQHQKDFAGNRVLQLLMKPETTDLTEKLGALRISVRLSIM